MNNNLNNVTMRKAFLLIILLASAVTAKAQKEKYDLNGDGKVTLKEKVQYTAGQVTDKAKDVYAEAKDKTVEVAGKVADKAKDVYAEAKEKTVEVAGKVTEKAKDIYAEVKENAEDLQNKAEDAIDTLKQKFQEKKDSKEA